MTLLAVALFLTTDNDAAAVDATVERAAAALERFQAAHGHDDATALDGRGHGFLATPPLRVAVSVTADGQAYCLEVGHPDRRQGVVRHSPRDGTQRGAGCR